MRVLQTFLHCIRYQKSTVFGVSAIPWVEVLEHIRSV